MAEHDEKNILALVESSEQGDYDNANPFSALGGLHDEIPADDVMNNVVSPLVSFLSHGFPYKFTKHFVLFSAPIFLLCPFFFTLSPHYFIFFFTY